MYVCLYVCLFLCLYTLLGALIIRVDWISLESYWRGYFILNKNALPTYGVVAW